MNMVEMVSMTAETANAVVQHMTGGGTHMQGQLLAERMRNECNAPMIEAARQKEIRDAVAASKINDALKPAGVPAAEVALDPAVAAEALIAEAKAAPLRAAVPRRGKK
jgi:hypothetical protein